jgi:DNA-binding XRE family transcriptional regulator
MAVHKFRDLAVKKLGEKRAKEIEESADEEIEREDLELNLRAVRELAGKTQSDVATAAGASQGEISSAERRSDHLVSTLRRYVHALGGELEVVARFGDEAVKLRGV